MSFALKTGRCADSPGCVCVRRDAGSPRSPSLCAGSVRVGEGQRFSKRHTAVCPTLGLGWNASGSVFWGDKRVHAQACLHVCVPQMNDHPPLFISAVLLVFTIKFSLTTSFVFCTFLHVFFTCAKSIDLILFLFLSCFE